MTLYEAIFARRSVRSFCMLPLDAGVLSAVESSLSEINQLNGFRARFTIVGPKEVTITGIKAPHYILAYCSESTGDFINVGYSLQKIDLMLQAMNLGSVWLGRLKPKQAVARQDFCIAMGFGRTNMPYRAGEAAFKRLPLSEITNQYNAASKAARLAPSAMNSQPWEVSFEDNRVTVNYCGRGILKAALKKKMSKVDIGIITRHIEIALLHEGRQIESIVPKAEGNGFSIEIILIPTQSDT